MSNAEMIKRLAKASQAVGGALATDKTNTYDKYDYISADKILTVCGQALADAGVMVVPSIVGQDAVEASYGNKTRWDASVSFVMIVTDGEGSLEMPWVGRGADARQPDKALYKAITSGHRYFIAKLLNVGVGNEDGEHDAPDQSAPRKAQPNVDMRTVKPIDPDPPTESKDAQPAHDEGSNGNGNGHDAMERFVIAVREANKGKPASAKSYNWLAGELDNITDGQHNAVLSALLGEEVSSDNRPSQAVVSKLLNRILVQRKDKESGKMQDNPEYSADVVAVLRSMAQSEPA